jgi:uncharacterized membrane protein
MSRKRIDLKKLPVWMQYLISLTVVAVIVAAAWLVGRDQPVPAWIMNVLIPVLGVLYLILLTIVIVRRLRRKK